MKTNAATKPKKPQVKVQDIKPKNDTKGGALTSVSNVLKRRHETVKNSIEAN